LAAISFDQKIDGYLTDRRGFSWIAF